MRAPLLLLAALTWAFSPTCQSAEPDVPRAISPSVWAAKLQAVTRKARLENNEADKDAIRATVFSDLRDETDGRRVRFSARISEVRWKDGIATLVTAERRERGLRETGEKPSLKVRRSTAFDAVMPQQEAQAIKRGAKLQVEAILAAKWGTVWGSSERDGQLMFKVTLPTGHARYEIGAYTKDYRLTLNGVELAPRWADDDGLLAGPESEEP